MAGRELYDFLKGRGVDTTKMEEEKELPLLLPAIKLSEQLIKRDILINEGIRGDLLTVQRIFVQLVGCDSEFTRRPIAHTCGCVLELPSNYESFVEFRREFNGILESRIWIMDII